MFDYYCVDCGEKFRGDEIRFDLAEFLGLRDFKSGGIGNSATHISPAELMELADHSGEKLEHGTRSRIEVTLRELLEKMGENAGKGTMRHLMSECTYDGIEDAIRRVFRSNENAEVAAKLSGDYTTAILNKFSCILDEQDEPLELSAEEEAEERQELSNYHAFFWIEPEFFDDGASDKIYTVRYSPDAARTANMKKITAPLEIRGYCPVCGKPVVMGAGRYRHTLIGLLGVQSAGKTSTIVALLAEMRRSFRDLGVVFPGNALCDSRYSDRELNVRLYESGWAVYKTNVETSDGTFNASFLLQPAKGGDPQIFTFIDIAGEQCYDQQMQEMNPAALEVYPLINSCDLYLLCTVIDQTGYGNADGVEAFISPDAVLQIAKGIYENLRTPQNVPPLCILVTKADMAADASAGAAGNNPFQDIRMESSYAYRDQMELIKTAFDATDNPDIRESLQWCHDTYDQLKNVTYLSIMSCSALGRMGTKYDGDIRNIRPYEEDGKKKPFARERIDVLWGWILRVTGLLPMEDGYRFQDIPSFGESYYDRELNQERDADCRPRKLYEVDQSLNRIKAVKKMFMNPSRIDNEVQTAWIDDRKLFGKKPKQRVREVLKRYDS